MATTLQRTGVSSREVFATRRERRRRPEVPAYQAGTAFDAAVGRELDAWSDLAVYTEVPYTGQAVLSMRRLYTIKKADLPMGAPR